MLRRDQFEATFELRRPVTHAFTVAQAIELARSLDRLPERLLVVGTRERASKQALHPGSRSRTQSSPPSRRSSSFSVLNY